MTIQLTNNDYINILKFYNIEIPKSKRLLKKHAENIMAQKLCKCIKKVDINNEPKSIGICTKTIFNNKGYTRGKFTCKKNKKQLFKFTKTKKNISFTSTSKK